MGGVLPLFYCATKVLCVDDDQGMLLLYQSLLGEKYQLYTTTSPIEARDLLLSSDTLSNVRWISDLSHITNLHDSDDKSIAVGFDFNKILELKNSKVCNKIYSTMLVDYNMGAFNGLDLCRDLHSLPIKKILLTGENHDSKVIDAFNNKVIDGYINKNGADSDKCLETLLKQVQFCYFAELTLPIAQNLKALGCKQLFDTEFIKFFNEFVEKNNICEYYMINRYGTYLMIDALGNELTLVVHDAQSLQYNFIEPYAKIEEVEYLLAEVIDAKKIPYFGINIQPSDVPFSEWDKYFYTSEVLQTSSHKYYFAIVRL